LILRNRGILFSRTWRRQKNNKDAGVKILMKETPVSADTGSKPKRKRTRNTKKKSEGLDAPLIKSKEGLTKCSKECKGMKKESSAIGRLVFKCECKSKPVGLEAKQPGSFMAELAATSAGINLVKNQFDVMSSTDGVIGSCFVIRTSEKKYGIVFNNHFLDYAGPHVKINDVVINLTLEAKRYKKTDLRCQPLDIADGKPNKFVLTVTAHPEKCFQKIYIFTRKDGKSLMSTGIPPKVEPDTSGTYLHCTSDYHSLPAYCGSIISLDHATVSGIHYHTNGEGRGNNYIPFTPAIVEWFKSL